MPPKNSGQKRKRTNAEKLALIKAEWDEKKRRKEQGASNDEAETEETPSKKQKTTPKGETKSGTASRKTRASARRKDPPNATPPRPSSASKKKSAAAPFNSPVPVARAAAKAPPPQDDGDDSDGDKDVITPPIPLPDEYPTDKKAGGLGFRPSLSSKLEREEPKQEAVPTAPPAAAAAVAKPEQAEENQDDDSDDYSDDSFDEDSQGSEGSDDENTNRLRMELERLQNQGEHQIAMPVPQKPSLASRIFRFIIRYALIGLVVYYVLPKSIRNLIPPLFPPGPSPTLCFNDSPHDQQEEAVKLASACTSEDGSVILWDDCPTDAYCRGGKLLQCPDGFEVTEAGCVPTVESNETLDAIVGLLQTWTALDICKGNPERHEYGLGGRPLFHFSRVTGELERGYNIHLIQQANHSRFLLTATGGNDLWIGLHPKVHVPISYLCFTKRTVYGGLGIIWSIVTLCFSLALYAVKEYWGWLVDDPPFVGGGTFFLFIMLSLVWRDRVEKNARLLLENDMHECRKLAFEILSSDPNKQFTVAELADKVKWRRYEGNRKGRDRVKKVIMPKIAREFALDSRLQVFRRSNNGVSEDLWKWVGGPLNSDAQTRTVHFAGTGQ